MKRIQTPRREFTYTVGEDPTVLGVADLPNHPHMQAVYDNWIIAEKLYEREWRNFELTDTDWMLVPDATFGGELLAGSLKLAEVIAYRAALREYNLTTDPRPERPDWL